METIAAVSISNDPLIRFVVLVFLAAVLFWVFRYFVADAFLQKLVGLLLGVLILLTGLRLFGIV